MKLLTITAFAFITFFLAAPANAQPTKRIQFTKGKSSATVSGSTGMSGVYYTVRARSGQKLVLGLTPILKVGITVTTFSTYGHEVLLREERGGTYEVGLEESGDYTIFVGSTNGKPAAFTLTVKIGKLSDI